MKAALARAETAELASSTAQSEKGATGTLAQQQMLQIQALNAQVKQSEELIAQLKSQLQVSQEKLQAQETALQSAQAALVSASAGAGQASEKSSSLSTQLAAYQAKYCCMLFAGVDMLRCDQLEVTVKGLKANIELKDANQAKSEAKAKELQEKLNEAEANLITTASKLKNATDRYTSLQELNRGGVLILL